MGGHAWGFLEVLEVDAGSDRFKTTAATTVVVGSLLWPRQLLGDGGGVSNREPVSGKESNNDIDDHDHDEDNDIDNHSGKVDIRVRSGASPLFKKKERDEKKRYGLATLPK